MIASASDLQGRRTARQGIPDCQQTIGDNRLNGFSVETSPVRPLHAPEKVGGWKVIHPDQDDVVVRQRRGNRHVLYLLGTPATPDQFSIGTRFEAVTQAVAFARQQRVRAWFDDGDNTFLLLGTFREET